MDELMVEIARHIQRHCHKPLPLAELAKEALLSPARLQKRFKAAIGLSPKEFQEACRLKRFKRHLRGKASISEALYETGHGSPSRVYGKLSQRVGMTPRQYQRQGEGLEISYAVANTPLGKMLIGATDRGVCFIQFGRSKAELLRGLAGEFPRAKRIPSPRLHAIQFKAWITALNDYLQGAKSTLDLPLDLRGTAFQLKVWKFLQKIPKGKVLSYAELARGIGHPRAVRAVASACARNRVAIVVPCHRVLRASGELGGYRWGATRKRKLLELEKGNGAG